MAETLTISGRLSEKDQRKLIDAAKGDSIGPTTLYYAGVTAPVIGAGMAVFGRDTLANLDFLSPYWLALLSTILAAMAGIVWYLIFVRWSMRRGDNILLLEDYDKEVTLEQNHITLKRRKVETRIELSDIEMIKDRGGDIIIRFKSAAPIFIPKHWFEDQTPLQERFLQQLKERSKV